MSRCARSAEPYSGGCCLPAMHSPPAVTLLLRATACVTIRLTGRVHLVAAAVRGECTAAVRRLRLACNVLTGRTTVCMQHECFCRRELGVSLRPGNYRAEPDEFTARLVVALRLPVVSDRSAHVREGRTESAPASMLSFQLCSQASPWLMLIVSGGSRSKESVRRRAGWAVGAAARSSQ